MTRRWLLFLFAPTLIALAYWGASAIGSAARSGMAAPATEPIVDPIEDKASFRILFGLTDKQSTEWDGSVSIASGAPGRVAGVEPWRFEGEDRIEDESWKLSTHLGWLVWAPKPGSRGEMRQSFFDRPGMKIVANGVVATLHDLVAESAVQVRTKQGDFEFRSRDVPYGSARKFLDGRGHGGSRSHFPGSGEIIGRSGLPCQCSRSRWNPLGRLLAVHPQSKIHPDSDGFWRNRSRT